jgi:hypothetical protein
LLDRGVQKEKEKGCKNKKKKKSKRQRKVRSSKMGSKNINFPSSRVADMH